MAQTTGQLIHQLRAQTPTLEALAAKRIRLNHDAVVGSGMASAPAPMNLAVADLLDQLRELALLLCRAAGLHPVSGMSLAGLLAGLDRGFVVERLESRTDAEDILRVLESAVSRARWFTSPDDRTRCVGVCAECGYGVWVDDSADLEHGQYKCEMCGAHGDLATVFAAHRMLLLMSDNAGTPAQLAKLLRSCGYQVSRRIIAQWGRRGKLAYCGDDEDGNPVYKLASVLRLL